MDAIDSIHSPVRDISKPVIMPICDVVKSQSTGQVSAIGKLEAGALRNGSKVQFEVSIWLQLRAIDVHVRNMNYSLH